jgi:predicted GNAT family acetyltransferase
MAVAADPESVDLTDDRVDVLGREDVDDIQELVRLTRPGPFLADTIELGRYLGIRRNGDLVAMAGERFRVAGATEVSAICTHPDHRGQGLAERLTMIVVDGILARGELPFLHVITDNTPAIRLYEKLGFVVGIEYDAIAVRAPGGGPPDTSELTVH